MDTAHAYAEADRRLQAIDSRISDAARYLAEAADALLSSRGKFSISGLPTAGLPQEAVLGRGCKSMDANNWPSPEQILALLREWHLALEAGQAASEALPRELRDRITPPASLLDPFSAHSI